MGTMLPGGEFRSHGEWKRLTSLTGLLLIFLLGTFHLRSTACKRLSTPKMGEIYFPLMERDARIELLR